MPSLLYLLMHNPRGLILLCVGEGWQEERDQNNALCYFARWLLDQLKMHWNAALCSCNHTFFPDPFQQLCLETCLDSDGVPTLYTAKVPLSVAVGAFPNIYLPPQTEPLLSASLVSSAPTFQASLHPLWNCKPTDSVFIWQKIYWTNLLYAIYWINLLPFKYKSIQWINSVSSVPLTILWEFMIVSIESYNV